MKETLKKDLKIVVVCTIIFGIFLLALFVATETSKFTREHKIGEVFNSIEFPDFKKFNELNIIVINKTLTLGKNNETK